MTQGQFIQRERTLLQDLHALGELRTELQERAETEYRDSGTQLQQQYDELRETLATRYREDRAAAQTASRTSVAHLRETIRHDVEATEHAYETERGSILEKANTNDTEARKQWDEAVWVSETVYEASEGKPEELFRETECVIEERRSDLMKINDHARTLLRKYRQKLPPDPDPDDADVSGSTPDEGEVPSTTIDNAVHSATEHLMTLRVLRIPRQFRGYILPFYIVLVLAGAGALTAWQRQWQVDLMVAGMVGGTLILLLGLSALLYATAKRQVLAEYRPLREAVQRGFAACDAGIAHAADRRDRRETEMLEQRDRDIATAKEKYEPIVTQIGERRDLHLQRIELKYPKLLKEIQARGEEELREAEQRHQQRMNDLQTANEQNRNDADAAHARKMEERETLYQQRWGHLVDVWQQGMNRGGEALDSITEQQTAMFPLWGDARWDGWEPPTTFLPSIRLGAVSVDLSSILGGLPEDERLPTTIPHRFDLPVTVDFPEPCSLLMLSDAEGRDRAVRTLQAVMLRLLTAVPPGKARFTIVDPVGLGQNFAGFMHLADYEESFVASRIWTETRHIEQRLADLTEHMETVIQKYLRNEFETIAQYNEQAGEIAEPYRFLVISDFPANFSDTAARRLASIVTSGARCGVYTLVSVDRRQGFPQGIELSDLESRSVTLEQDEEGIWRWKDETFAELPLALDDPPDEEFLTHKLHLIGDAAKDATRVEVPFTNIAPPEGKMWSRECSTELAVPLGRAGATKLQQLIVGPGTSQHALIAGKTGSGKSTMLHVLVTNLALWYSPDEVQFYLVDFKKGVEFKTYATHRLPHARAVAVESDREFGLSVLQRVDLELKSRGDRFRELGIQDLAGYRRLGLDEPMPRTLLIIDEFQEMFTEDDKLGQDATLLMDRLVRQGRAFGIHVILGSQTLGGAYTLARTTMGQMQVRIALQCSESDSYLIMSDDNAAARLLSRPGEAIYNDAGGRIEGNSPFQICWLPESEREVALRTVEELAINEGYERSEPLIVFEGNVPAQVEHNHYLNEFLDAPTWPREPGASQAWMGDAIAIKGPTAALFQRQSGANVLMVGQRDESALAMVATSMISLAAQRDTGPEGAQFLLLDGTPTDAPHAGYLKRIADALPHDIQVVRWRDVDEAVANLAEIVKQRQADDATDAPPIYVIVFGLQRFRMLRFTDEFAFSMDEEKPAATDRMFADILRDGPPLGVHTITWCDTATNLNRTLDRNGLREFEMRVLFQMSGADSTQLIDSPAAGKLGLRRALFYNEEEGVLEKFRPYALPDAAWLETVAQRLAGKQAQ